MDGFSPTGAQTSDLTKVLAFRDRLQRDQMVAFLEPPADLEARVSAAVASVGLRGQMIENSARLHGGSFQGIAANQPINDSGLMPLRTLINSKPAPEVATIEVKTEWWFYRHGHSGISRASFRQSGGRAGLKSDADPGHSSA